MKNLATKPLISRALTLLVLGLIAAQPFVVTWPAFAAAKMSAETMISNIPLGPSSQWWLFCWYYYVDEKDKTSEVQDMQTCQRQNTYFASVFTDQNGSLNQKIINWSVTKLDQLNLPGMTSASQLQDALVKVFKNPEILTSDSALSDTLFDWERPDAIRDILNNDPNMQMAGPPPATIPDAFNNVFCQQEQTNGVIPDVTDCQSLATPFMDESVLSMFKGGTNADVQAVTKAWLAGNSLQVLALKADSGVMESDWMSALQGAVDQNNNALVDLTNNQNFMMDLWMWAPMPLLGASMGG